MLAARDLLSTTILNLITSIPKLYLQYIYVQYNVGTQILLIGAVKRGIAHAVAPPNNSTPIRLFSTPNAYKNIFTYYSQNSCVRSTRPAIIGAL